MAQNLLVRDLESFYFLDLLQNGANFFGAKRLTMWLIQYLVGHNLIDLMEGLARGTIGQIYAIPSLLVFALLLLRYPDRSFA